MIHFASLAEPGSWSGRREVEWLLANTILIFLWFDSSWRLQKITEYLGLTLLTTTNDAQPPATSLRTGGLEDLRIMVVLNMQTQRAVVKPVCSGVKLRNSCC